jgi:lysophospholipase L1-like esterase
VPTKDSYPPEADSTANLKRFVSETRSHRGQLVLLTRVARCKFDEAGKIEETHDTYAELVRAVARETNTLLIDLDRTSQALLQQFGSGTCKLLFNHLAPGDHPNYPDGREDNTHFSELGARRMAELVLAYIRALKLSLADRIVQGTVKKTVDPQAR